MGQLVFQATAGGQVALVGPNPSTSFSLNVPAINGTLVTTGDTGTVTNTMLASSAYTAPGTIGSGTANTGAFTSLSATSFTNTGTDTATKFIPTGSSVAGNGLYLPATNALGLSTNGTNALYIDSSQNVGINCAPSAWNSSFKALQISGYLSAWSAGASNQFIYANAYYSNTADTYYANGYAQRIIMSSNSGGYTFADSASGTAGGAITWVTTLALSKDKTVVLQGASQSTGTGIAFPATQSASSDANTLDDYEEGTWTPIDSSGAGLSFSVANGTYTKIGRMVYCQGNVTYPSTANTAQVTIGGLPFTSSSQLGIGGFITYTDFPSYIPTLPMSNSNTIFYMYTTSGANAINVSVSARNFRFTIIYSV